MSARIAEIDARLAEIAGHLVYPRPVHDPDWWESWIAALAEMLVDDRAIGLQIDRRLDTLALSVEARRLVAERTWIELSQWVEGREQ